MALIENSKGREEGGGYERLFGDQQLGHLLSRIQATVISSGTELEKLIVSRASTIDDVDNFLLNLPVNGVFLASKAAIKKSKLKSDKEPDILIFKVDPLTRHCYIIELKDGDNFDTKKAAGEVALLKAFQNHLSSKIPFTTSLHICMFNQLDKEKIVAGFKRTITLGMAMTGQELCTLLGIEYDEIISSRTHEQKKNMAYFVNQLLEVEVVKKMIEKKYGISQ